MHDSLYIHTQINTKRRKTEPLCFVFILQCKKQTSPSVQCQRQEVEREGTLLLSQQASTYKVCSGALVFELICLLNIQDFLCLLLRPPTPPPLFPFGTLLSFIFSRLRSCLLLFFSLPFLPSTKRLYYVNDLFIWKAISCSQKKIPPFTYYSHVHWTLTQYFYSLHLHFIIY